MGPGIQGLKMNLDIGSPGCRVPKTSLVVHIQILEARVAVLVYFVVPSEESATSVDGLLYGYIVQPLACNSSRANSSEAEVTAPLLHSIGMHK